MPYIRRVAEFIAAQTDSQIEIGGDVTGSGLVFVIGGTLPPIKRRPGTKYVYINFSPVKITGFHSFKSMLWFRKMRGILQARAREVDAVLDYYPSQTKHLSEIIEVPVFSFPVAVAPVPRKPVKYDICFVGTASKRRRRMVSRIDASFSPRSGLDLEDVAACSRLTLNVHYQRGRHLEVPRIIGSLAAGTPVVSETSLGQENYPIRTGDYRSLPRLVAEELETPTQVGQWYIDEYLPGAKTQWAEIMQKI